MSDSDSNDDPFGEDSADGESEKEDDILKNGPKAKKQINSKVQEHLLKVGEKIKI